ncbi:protein argonaute MEL1-like [Salvia miltiorrhiza]|uniref:protein argonaute MEL1-like n=1 Tax=Salvia miltiorrhiza TaxID=226208 RepID=UPI0025AB9A7F|nr:protein argonaute MEL1-like [Salvia miltiorrhiza]
MWIPAKPKNIGRICCQPDWAPHQPAEPAVWLSLSMEQKLDLEASASTPEQAAQPENPPPVQPELPLARRPGFGHAGLEIIIKANHFLVAVADKDLHHYDVSISPEVASKKVCREIIDLVMKGCDFPKEKLAYDGRSSCYAASSLPFESKYFAVELVDADSQSRRIRKFQVSIKLSSKPDLYQLKQFIQGRQLDLPQETIQLFNVVLKQYQYKSGLVVGRSCFHRGMGNGRDLGNGLDYVPGFYQSLRPTQMGLSLNIDMSGTAFFQPILVVDYVAKHINKDLTSGLSDQDRTEVKRALKGVLVETHHLGQIRRHRISGISMQSTQQLMFSLDGKGTQISVAQYFSQKYNIVLQFPNLPAVEAGSDTKPIYLPMELCSIVDHQRYSRKLNVTQVTKLLRITCIQPSKREYSIKQVVEENHGVNDDAYKKFGICVSSNLTSIKARVLPPPTLSYHDETGKEILFTPTAGQWSMKNMKMINGGKIKFWACINFSRVSDANVGQFCDDLIGLCSRKGMTCNQEPLVPVRSVHGPIEKALFDLKAETSSELRKLDATEKQLQLLIVILPDITDSYGTIKRVCETELGIVSQCLQSKNIMQSRKQHMKYMENVALKINAKVGGRNWELEDLKLELTKEFPYFRECPTIIFGAAVTHPQAGDDSSPSIAAVVASMNFPEVTTKYRGLVSAQARREEIIQDLYIEKVDPKRGLMRRGMIRELLTSFYRATGYKPRRIIFYRDGVSEGQFSQVLLHEMKAIREACASVEEYYIPTVTFIVVQKRHHTRLFPADHNTDRSGNVLPGTVVDTEICHPTGFDFYLCSHAGIKGTSRPTHYHVLYDENEFSADGLQMLTNRLCYTYARCTRSVSVVPPVYYAHLAARRARHYIQATDFSDSGSTSDATRERQREVQPLPTIKDNVKDVMFYI